MSIPEIGRAAGVSEGTVRNVILERVARVSTVPARALMGLGGSGAGQADVPSLGTARRLQALAAIGWDGPALAAELAWSADFIRHLRAGTTSSVHAATHARVAAAYPRLALRPQQGVAADRVRSHAARQGWVGPASWDDDELDDPSVVIAVPTVLSRAQRTQAQLEDVRDMLATAEHPLMIAHRLGLHVASVQRLLDRHEPDLAAAFLRASHEPLGRPRPAQAAS